MEMYAQTVQYSIIKIESRAQQWRPTVVADAK